MLVLIKGAGDIASGIAMRLHNAGMGVAMTELAQPTAIRRTVCFSQAALDGETTVEGISARLCRSAAEAEAVLEQGIIPIMVDESAVSAAKLKPDALVDAILAKRNTGTSIADAPIVIGVGPGFTAGVDCHAAVETQRGHSLGRALYSGTPERNTGIPGSIGGFTVERVIRSPHDGVFKPVRAIGDIVKAGDTVATVISDDGEYPVTARIDGVLRGLLPNGIRVHHGMKSGDVDPRCKREHCYVVSDKALAVGGGVLEAILHFTVKNRDLIWKMTSN